MVTKRVISHFMSSLFMLALLLAQAGPAYATGSGAITGAATMSDLAEPYPAPYYLKASPAEDRVHARGWLEGATLDLTIRNAANTLSHSTSAVVAQAPWNPNGPDDQVAIFELNGDWDVQVGDVVTVTDDVKEETLTVVDTTQLHWLSGNDNIEGVTAQQDAAHAYNLANPEIELLFIVGLPGDNADYPADVFGPRGILASNAFKGEWLDLASLITLSGYDTSQFAPQLMELYHNEDEGQFGLPFLVFPNMLYYQKGMFDAAGLNYPPANYGDAYVLDSEPVEWSIATMNEVAKRLTLDNTGKNATQPGFDPNNIVQYGYVPQWQSSIMVASLWGAGTMVGGTPGAYTASIPDQWVLAWKAYYNGIWGQEPFIPNGSAMYSPEIGQGNPFNSGKFAMATAQTWYLCCIGDAGANWELGTIPSYAGTVHGVFHADGFRIFKNTPHPQEAFDVLMYLNDNTNLLEAYGGMPAHTSAQADFLARKEAQFPFVDNWHLLQEGLNYIDDPHHESWLPNLTIAWERLSQFQDRLMNYPGLNMDNEIEVLRSGLEHIFNTGVNPGWPNPKIEAWFEDDFVFAIDWPIGEELTLEIDDPDTILYPDHTVTETVTQASHWDPNVSVLIFDFDGEFDLQPGMTVKVSGIYAQKELIVDNLVVDGAYAQNDTVFGTTAPDRQMWILVLDQDPCCRHFSSDSHGNWVVDFSVLGNDGEPLINLVPGSRGFVYSTDYDGDDSVASWNVPISAFSKTAPANGAISQSLFPTLSWQASADATGYQYCIDTTNDNACASWVSTGSNTSVSLSGLNPNTTYYWQVRATNPDGTTYANGLETAFWSFTTGEATATFPDVPTGYWAWAYVERLYNAGLTGGYPDGTYRPANTVTRAEMAIFLMKGMNGPAYTPPTVSPTFTDTDSHWAANWIEALKTAGLTGGYPDGTYRPNSPVTRAEMAIFLLKAMNGAAYSPPVASPTFSDTAEHWAANWIEALKAAGITSGYPDGTYRPGNYVTRAEMAVFLVKAFGLP